ncbi:hypothetical protein VB711_10460 [Cronbergia sp. UHCC 0137]|uniref:hypothetical protein n=1 Tax=Cronbergia sp. UHCC 0137 TaxID=3110239 RepID=UPI002B1FCB1B|nr:hypothetical protein [Cronbergia sp. UHCC 0137]MEA5618254.1 hypothetical protein [Cronbergia sp. UHCC 0137]
MLELKKLFNQSRQKISIILLACLVWIISLPAASVHATGYYSTKANHLEITRPYYSSKNRPVTRKASFIPYYSTKDRHKEKVYTTPGNGENYVESGRRAGEVIPNDLGTGSRQKNPINMLKRAGGELSNDPLQRTFGAKDYQRSEIENELARNKAARGDFN